jgi:hypothetical protein
MKFSMNQFQRRSLVPLAGVALALYYVMVFLPLKKHATDLDVPLQQAWRKLASSLEQSNKDLIDFMFVTNQLAETQDARTAFDAARERMIARLELPPSVRSRMNGAFQLVDFENERSKEQDELIRLAKQQQVSIEPAVYAGLPDYSLDVRRPELLWPALEMADGLLQSALQEKLTAVHTLQSSVLLTNTAAGGSDRLAQIPFQIELSGPYTNVSRWLFGLSLRGDELRAAGVSQAASEKPPLFIDRLVIKKQAADKPDDVHVLLRVIGFVMRESTQALD